MSYPLKLFVKFIQRIYRNCKEQKALIPFGFINAVGTKATIYSIYVGIIPAM